MKNMMKALVVCALMAGTVAAQDADVSVTQEQQPATKDVVVTFEVEGKPVRVTFKNENIEVLVEGKAAKFKEKRVARNHEFVIGYDVATTNAAGAFVAEAFVRSQEKRRIIGVEVKELEEALAAQVGVKADEAMVIVRVRKDGPAAKAGLKKFDVVTAIQGQRPATLPRLRAALDKLQVGDPIVLDVVRGGKNETVRIEVGEEGPTGFEVFVAPTVVDGVVTLNPMLKSTDVVFGSKATPTTGFVQLMDATANPTFVYDPALLKAVNGFTVDSLVPGEYAIATATTGPDVAVSVAPDAAKPDQLAALEKRLARIEKLLTDLAEKK